MISILLLLFLMLYPEEALLCAQKGMQLWLNILIPTLLPFMILTGILIRTDLISQILLPLEPFLSKIFGISSSDFSAVIPWEQKSLPISIPLRRSATGKRSISSPLPTMPVLYSSIPI